MRILGVNQKWDKLKQPQWTTFRFQRKDKDWILSEMIQVVYRPRSKQREILGVAKIISKEPRRMSRAFHLIQPLITNIEANEDGFPDGYDTYGNTKSGYFFMWEWLFDIYGGRRLLDEPMNKLTLRWVKNEQA